VISLTSRDYILDQIRGIGSNLVYGSFEAGSMTATQVEQHLKSLLDLILLQAQSHLGQWSKLRFVASGGEALTLALRERFRRAFPDAQLVNFYGTTECSATVASFDTSKLPEQASRIPIGAPVSNMRVYILDEVGCLAPIGAVGELFVSGPGVCPGYLNNPAQNAESFLRDSFAADASQRMFRTRDLGRYVAPGRIEVLGRRDHQIKVRGFRVDLSEVEATLRRHPGVVECAGSTFEHERYTAIAAYFVAPATVNEDELREWLAERLPHYMVPQRFLRLAQLPRTASGKVAYRKLPSAADVPEHRRVSLAQPTDEVEARLLTIWQEILNVSPIGTQDNFFALGGHSLAAADMSLRIERELGAQVSIATLYQGAATVERLARVVREAAA